MYIENNDLTEDELYQIYLDSTTEYARENGEVDFATFVLESGIEY